jgi:hypothetical protein
MLADWYFCSCIRIPAKAAANYLCVLEALRSPDSDARMLNGAYLELTKTESWMQLNALSRVLGSLRHPASTGDLGDIPWWLDPLVEQDDARLSRALAIMTRAALAAEDSGLLDPLPDCAAILVDRAVELPPVPYLDLTATSAHVLWLTYTADACERSRNFASALTELVEQDEEVYRLIASSLKGRWGRLGQRLAVRVARGLITPTLFSPDRIIADLWEHPGACPLLEPDLMATTAEVLFRPGHPDPTPRERAAAVAAISEETYTLAELRRLRSDFPDVIKRMDGVIPRFDPEAAPSRALAIVLWQSTLWELATALDPSATAAHLRRLWRAPELYEPPGQKGTRRLPAWGPVDGKEELADWHRDLSALLDIRNLSIDVRIVTSYAAECDEEADRDQLLFSPWVPLSYASGPHVERYPTARDTAALVRLCASTNLAVQILQARSSAEVERPLFCEFLAHAVSVIEETYDRDQARRGYRYLRAVINDQVDPALTPPLSITLTALAVFARSQGVLAGTGHLPAIDPAEFVALLGSDTMTGPPKRLSRQEQFLRDNLPPLLVDWVMDAWTGAVDTRTAGRWLAGDRDLLRRALTTVVDTRYPDTGRPRYGFIDRLNAALLLRFLVPDHRADLSEFNWVAERQRRKDRLPSARDLLLTPDIDAASGVQYPPDDERGQAFRIALAVERLAALGSGRPADEPQAAGWCAGWLAAAADIHQPRQLDRLVRLRLLELLDRPTPGGPDNAEVWYEVRQQILFLLYEFGGAYEHEQLFERIFFSPRIPPDYHLDRLRYDAMVLFLRERLGSRAFEERVYQVGDPRRGSGRVGKRDVVERFLARVSFELGAATNLATGITYAHLFDQLRTSCLRRRGDAEDWTATADLIERAGGASSLEPAPDQALPDDRFLEGAVVDRTNRRVRLFAAALETDFVAIGDRRERVFDLFGDDEARMRAFWSQIDRGPCYVLAVVAERQEVPGGKVHYRFRCGPGDYLPQVACEDQGLSPGTWVALPVRGGGRDDPKRLVADPGPGGRPVKRLDVRLSSADELQLLQVREEDWQGERRVRVCFHDGSVLARGAERNLWDADLSRSFRPVEEGGERFVFGRRLPDRGWVPESQELPFLIARYDLGAPGSVAVLTFLERYTAIKGQHGWRFAARPGENYQVLARQFFDEDARRLEEQLEGLRGSAHGLLVCVSAGVDADGFVRLRLSDRPPDGPIAHPSLAAPFDDRNLRWKRLFEESTEVAIKRPGGRWEVAVDVPGFPTSLLVRWESVEPRLPHGQVEFYPSRLETDWRKPYVRGRMVPVYELRAVDDLQRRRTYDALANMREGSQFRIERIAGAPWEGQYQVLCLTSEQLPLYVEVDSLTLGVVTERELKRQAHGRTAEIYYLRYDEPTRVEVASAIELDRAIGETAERLRAAGRGAEADRIARTAEFLGILARAPRRGEENARRCTAWFRIGPEVVACDLDIEGISTIPGLSVAARLTAARRPAIGWQFFVETWFARARARWSIRERLPEDDDASLVHLGRTRHRGVLHGLAQSNTQSGTLVLLAETSGDGEAMRG